MSEPLKLSLAAQLQTLQEAIGGDLSWPSPETEFARSVLSHFGVAAHFDFFAKSHNLDGYVNRMQEAPVLAAVGYTIAQAEPNTHALWAKSVERLTGRESFPNDRASFFFRPVELLGIATGIAVCPKVSSGVKTWLRNTLKAGESKIDRADCWTFCISSFSAAMHGVTWAAPHFRALSVEDLALSKWLSDVYPNGAAQLGAPDISETMANEFLRRSLLEGVPSRDIARGAVVYGALHSVAEKALLVHTNSLAHTSDAREVLVGICQRFHLLVQQLKTRRAGQAPLVVQDEYDVQYLMHAILKLHFDDIRPEEWCPSYAGRASRVDFLLKAEQIVVETKMTRKGLDDRKLGEELTLDKAKYRTHKDCRTLVCFVYDPEGYCKNPVALERDLTETAADFSVLVVVAPKGK